MRSLLTSLTAGLEPVVRVLLLLICLAFGPAAQAITLHADFRVPLGTLGTEYGTNEVDRWNYFAGVVPGFTNTQILQNHQDINTRRIRIFYDKSNTQTNLDKLVKAVIDAGAKPLLCFQFVPGYSYSQFGDWCASMVNRYKGMYDISGWYWELINEPDLTGWKVDSYISMYNTVEPKVRAAYPTIKLGGPCTSSASEAWIKGLLTRANAGGLQFVSWHRYGCYSSPPGPSDGQLLNETSYWAEDLDRVTVLVNRYRPGVLPIQGEYNMNAWAGDYNGVWSTDPRIKTIFNVAWYGSVVSRLIRTRMGNSVTAETWWEGTGDDVHTGAPGFGIWYSQEPLYRAPVYYARKLVTTHFPTGITLVSCDSDSPNVEVFAAKSGSNYCVAVVNKTTPITTVPLNLHGFNMTSGTWYTIDQASFDAGGIRSEPAVIGETQSVTLNGYCMRVLVASGTLQEPIGPPPAPTNVQVTDLGVSGGVRISWTPPDWPAYSHLHIYRSTVPGTAGTRVADNVTGTWRNDSGMYNGETYYYLIRSVDTYGNESTNTEQYAVVPTKSGYLRVDSVAVSPRTIAPGQTAQVEVSVSNPSTLDATIVNSGLRLTLYGSDVTSQCTITADASNTRSVPGQDSRILRYTLSVPSDFRLGPITVDAWVEGFVDSKNLIADWSFENASEVPPTGWGNYATPEVQGATWSYATGPGEYLHGVRSYKFSATGSTGSGTMLSGSSYASCSANQLFKFGMFRKTGGNSGAYKVMLVNERASDGSYISATWLWLDSTTSWAHGSSSLKTGTNTRQLNVELRMGTNAGQVDWVLWDLAYLIRNDYWVADLYAGTTATLSVAQGQVIESIGTLKSIEEGTAVTIYSKPVTASTSDIGGACYIEETDRSSGIRVQTVQSASEGDSVTVAGNIQAANGERFVDASNLYVISSGNSVPPPLAMGNRSAVGSGQDPTGLLLTLWGKVSAVDGQYYYIDDGSSVEAMGGRTGVRVSGISTGVPPLDSYVVATGVLGRDALDGANVPVLRARKPGDMVIR